MAYLNLNGKMVQASADCLPADNGAFRYGYGVFETMLVLDGGIRLAPLHWGRLRGSLEMLQLGAFYFSEEWMEQEVMRAVRYCGLEKLCRVRLQVFAGGGGLFGAGNETPGFVIECFEMEPGSLGLNEQGLVTGIYTGMRKQPDAWSGLKTCNALIYALAAVEARRNHWNDALVCNAEGRIIESAIANIFWVKGDELFTPPLSEGCIAGVMRRHLLNTWNVQERTLAEYELLHADEVFLTNAVRGIRWVEFVSGKKFPLGIARDIQACL